MEKRHMLCAALLILGSVTISGQKPEADVASVLGYPEQIYYNAKVVTMDDPGFNANPGTIAQAFAVRGDKILAIGTTAQIRRLAGPNTRQMDLKGRTVMPSFILTHEHPTDWAWTEPSALVHVFPEGNPNMVVRFLKGTADEQKANWEVALKEAVSTAKPKQWILLSSDWGGNFENMPGLANSFEQLVTTKRLDELAPNNPVRVKNSWITGKFNTRAMEEVRKIYPDAQLEGRGNRSEAGRQFEPDVMLYHKVALNADLLKAEMELWAAHGITLFGSSPYAIGNFQALSLLDREGRMPARFAWGYSGPDLHYETIRMVSAMLGNGSDYLWNIGLQGEISGGQCTTIEASAKVKAKEVDCSFAPGSEGRRVLEDIVRSGGRIATMHTGGDRDVDYLFDVIEAKSKEAGLTAEQIAQRRHAFDHSSGAPRPDQIPRMKRLGMMASMLNTMLWENRREYDTSFRVKNYGIEYAVYAVPRESVTKAGIMNTQEIDRALPHFIFYNVWAGMTRYNEAYQQTYGAREKTDRITQLKALTTWGSYYVLREDRLGSLERGKLADFIVLDRDILTVPESEIPQVKVLMTVVGGRTVHLLPQLATEIAAKPVGPTTWATRPLETRFVFKGPPKETAPVAGAGKPARGVDPN